MSVNVQPGNADSISPRLTPRISVSYALATQSSARWRPLPRPRRSPAHRRLSGREKSLCPATLVSILAYEGSKRAGANSAGASVVHLRGRRARHRPACHGRGARGLARLRCVYGRLESPRRWPLRADLDCAKCSRFSRYRAKPTRGLEPRTPSLRGSGERGQQWSRHAAKRVCAPLLGQGRAP